MARTAAAACTWRTVPLTHTASLVLFAPPPLPYARLRCWRSPCPLSPRAPNAQLHHRTTCHAASSFANQALPIIKGSLPRFVLFSPLLFSAVFASQVPSSARGASFFFFWCLVRCSASLSPFPLLDCSPATALHICAPTCAAAHQLLHGGAHNTRLHRAATSGEPPHFPSFSQLRLPPFPFSLFSY